MGCCFNKTTNCVPRVQAFSTDSLVARLMGKNEKESKEIETTSHSTRLSFNDYGQRFDEEKTSLLEQGHATLGFESDGDENFSETQSVDEGAINILSMEEIRKMKNLELDWKRTQSEFRMRQSKALRNSSQAFVASLGEDKEEIY